MSNVASAETDWAGEKYALEQQGYKIVYDPSIPVTQTDFTQNVVAMKNAGVKILFIDQLPQNYASALLKNLEQQNFHPQVILGGGQLQQCPHPQLGWAPQPSTAPTSTRTRRCTSVRMRPTIPAVSLFNNWVKVASPGFNADLFTLYGWLSAELFSQAPEERRFRSRAGVRCSRPCPRSPRSAGTTS